MIRGVITILAILVTGLAVCLASDGPDPETGKRYPGLTFYHSSATGGYGSNLSLNAGVEKDHRLLEGGMVFQPQTSRISGGNVIYRRFLFPDRQNPDQEGLTAGRNPRFFLQYKFQFRHTSVYNAWGNPGPVGEHQPPAGGRVATYDHHFGLGGELTILGTVTLIVSGGIGLSLVSVDEKFADQPHYTEGGRKTGTGPCLIVGIGYAFLD